MAVPHVVHKVPIHAPCVLRDLFWSRTYHVFKHRHNLGAHCLNTFSQLQLSLRLWFANHVCSRRCRQRYQNQLVFISGRDPNCLTCSTTVNNTWSLCNATNSVLTNEGRCMSKETPPSCPSGQFITSAATASSSVVCEGCLSHHFKIINVLLWPFYFYQAPILIALLVWARILAHVSYAKAVIFWPQVEFVYPHRLVAPLVNIFPMLPPFHRLFLVSSVSWSACCSQ